MDLGHLLDVQGRPYVFVGEQRNAVGVVDEMVDALGEEVGEERYHDGFIGIDAEESDGPFGGIAGAECDFVALLHSCRFEQDVDFLDVGGDFAVSVLAATEIAEGRVVPISLGDLFKFTEIVGILFLSGERFEIGMFHFIPLLIVQK